MDRIFDDVSAIDSVMLEKVSEDFIYGNPIKVEVGLEGQRQDDLGNLILGCRSGPAISVEFLLHEMAHLAQLEEERIAARPQYNWDFRYGKYWELCGQSGYEPQTDRSVLRERDVWAYQLSLLTHYDISAKDDKKDDTEAFALAKSAKFMDAFMFYKKRVKSSGGSYSQQIKEGLRYLAEEIESLSKTKFTFDRFCEEWDKRMQILKGNL